MTEAADCSKKKLGKLNNPHTAHRTIHSAAMARCLLQNPFSEFKITSPNFLDNLTARSSCKECGRSRKFFCYNCYIPIPELEGLVPRVNKVSKRLFLDKSHLDFS